MMKRFLSPALLAAIGLFGAASGAQAVNMVEISGNNVSYFYDSDFWGLNNATLTGNTLTFDTKNLLTTSAAVKRAVGNASDDVYWKDQAGVIAVAHQGSSVSANVASKSTFSGQFNGGSGAVWTTTGGYQVYSGEYANGAFNAAHSDDADGWGYNTFFRNSKAGSFIQQVTADYYQDGWTTLNLQALQVVSLLDLHAYQDSRGSTFGSVDQLSYEFTVTTAPAVPEPETYAMLLAGLGLLAAAARRTSRR